MFLLHLKEKKKRKKNNGKEIRKEAATPLCRSPPNLRHHSKTLPFHTELNPRSDLLVLLAHFSFFFSFQDFESRILIFCWQLRVSNEVGIQGPRLSVRSPSQRTVGEPSCGCAVGFRGRLLFGSAVWCISKCVGRE